MEDVQTALSEIEAALADAILNCDYSSPVSCRQTTIVRTALTLLPTLRAALTPPVDAEAAVKPEWKPIDQITDWDAFHASHPENIWIFVPARGEAEYVSGHMTHWRNWKPTHYCELMGYRPPPPSTDDTCPLCKEPRIAPIKTIPGVADRTCPMCGRIQFGERFDAAQYALGSDDTLRAALTARTGETP